MKKYIILLFALLAASPAFSQKKGKEDKKNAQPDSVTQVIDTAAVKVDSITTTVVDTAAVKVDSVAKTTTTVKTDSVAKAATTTAAKTDSTASKAPVTTIVVATTTTVKTDTEPKTKGAPSADMDSLTKVTQLLTAKFNTVNAELEKYRGVYTVLKEKVIKHDFDPAQFAQIVDSLVARRDSTQFGQTAIAAALRDSVATFKKDVAELRAKIDAAKVEETFKLSLVNELKTLKELLDAKILTQTEFDNKKALVLQKWK